MATPRPSVLLYLNSGVFVAASLFLGGIFLSGFAHWDPCVWFGTLFLGGPLFAITYLQYMSAFHASCSSVRICRVIFLLIGVVVFLAAGWLAVEPVTRGMVVSASHIVSVELPFFLIGAWLAWLGFLDFRWYRTLSQSQTESQGSGEILPQVAFFRRFRCSVAEGLVLVGALSIVLAGFSLGLRDIPPQVAMHVSPQEARLELPAGATDVCIYRGFRGTISFNFAIDEAGFWEWTKSIGGTLESKSSNVEIEPIRKSFTLYNCSHVTGNFERVSINRGWVYDWHYEDRALQYAYDADTGRAYFLFHAY